MKTITLRQLQSKSRASFGAMCASGVQIIRARGLTVEELRAVRAALEVRELRTVEGARVELLRVLDGVTVEEE